MLLRSEGRKADSARYAMKVSRVNLPQGWWCAAVAVLLSQQHIPCGAAHDMQQTCQAVCTCCLQARYLAPASARQAVEGVLQRS